MSAAALGGGRSGAGVAPVLSRAETVEVLLEAARQVGVFLCVGSLRLLLLLLLVLWIANGNWCAFVVTRPEQL